MALTYVEAYTLRRTDLELLMADYPEAERIVYKASRRILMQRSLLKYMSTVVLKRRTPASFVTKSASRGATEIVDSMKLEQKVDATMSM